MPFNTVRIIKKNRIMLKITQPITGAELQVAIQDFPNPMSWDKAERACSELGSGWRLPTKEELEAMYIQLHKKGQGNFNYQHYWSSTEYDDGHAWDFGFNDGAAKVNYKGYTYYARAVRAL